MIRLKEQLTGQSPNVVRLTLKVDTGLVGVPSKQRAHDRGRVVERHGRGIKTAGFSHKGCNLPSTDVPNFSSESRNVAGILSMMPVINQQHLHQ